VDGGCLVVGYVGALMPHKGAHVAVEAFREIPATTARLKLWGDENADLVYVGRLRARANPESTEFLGRFDSAERAAVLGAVDVLLIPSVGLESFGIVAHEAMAAGVPVIASRLGALAELGLDDGCGATFAPGDHDALRNLILEVAADRSILERWRRHLTVPTTVEAHAAAVEDVYRQVLGIRP
jgi:glycosyltransferase involved in cell wall biosynthesis